MSYDNRILLVPLNMFYGHTACFINLQQVLKPWNMFYGRRTRSVPITHAAWTRIMVHHIHHVVWPQNINGQCNAETDLHPYQLGFVLVTNLFCLDKYDRKLIIGLVCPTAQEVSSGGSNHTSACFLFGKLACILVVHASDHLFD